MFSQIIDEWADEAEARITTLRKVIILALFSSVIKDSPVKEGRLRGNWQISSGTPKSGTLKMTDPKGNKSIARVEKFVEKRVISKDQATFLTNNLPYAFVVEYGGYNGPTDKVTPEGFSKKSPQGMVRKNFIRITENLNGVT